MISADPRYERRKVTVKGLNMAYVEAGSGAPMVFIHGNPTSSYLWRNVMPHLEAEARVIADRCLKRINKKGNRLLDAGKHPNKVKVACAREMIGFVWESLNQVAA